MSMSKSMRTGETHMMDQASDAPAQANLTEKDAAMTVSVQDGEPVKARSSVSEMMHQALWDDMARRADVYRKLAQ